MDDARTAAAEALHAAYKDFADPTGDAYDNYKAGFAAGFTAGKAWAAEVVRQIKKNLMSLTLDGKFSAFEWVAGALELVTARIVEGKPSPDRYANEAARIISQAPAPGGRSPSASPGSRPPAPPPASGP